NLIFFKKAFYTGIGLTGIISVLTWLGVTGPSYYLLGLVPITSFLIGPVVAWISGKGRYIGDEINRKLFGRIKGSRYDEYWTSSIIRTAKEINQDPVQFAERLKEKRKEMDEIQTNIEKDKEVEEIISSAGKYITDKNNKEEYEKIKNLEHNPIKALSKIEEMLINRLKNYDGVIKGITGIIGNIKKSIDEETNNIIKETKEYVDYEEYKEIFELRNNPKKALQKVEEILNKKEEPEKYGDIIRNINRILDRDNFKKQLEDKVNKIKPMIRPTVQSKYKYKYTNELFDEKLFDQEIKNTEQRTQSIFSVDKMIEELNILKEEIAEKEIKNKGDKEEFIKIIENEVDRLNEEKENIEREINQIEKIIDTAYDKRNSFQNRINKPINDLKREEIKKIARIIGVGSAPYIVQFIWYKAITESAHKKGFDAIELAQKVNEEKAEQIKQFLRNFQKEWKSEEFIPVKIYIQMINEPQNIRSILNDMVSTLILEKEKKSSQEEIIEIENEIQKIENYKQNVIVGKIEFLEHKFNKARTITEDVIPETQEKQGNIKEKIDGKNIISKIKSIITSLVSSVIINPIKNHNYRKSIQRKAKKYLEDKNTDALFSLFTHSSLEIRENTAKALIDIGDYLSVKFLMKALSGTQRDVQIRANQALEVIKEERGIEPFIKNLKDEDNKVKSKAIELLGEIGDKQAVDPLIQLLNNKNSRVKEKAAEALGKIGDKQAVVPLTKLLNDEDSRVKEKAAEALGKMGEEQAVTSLIQLLSDESSKVREKAAEALGRIGDEQAVTPLIQLLSNENSKVREKAAEALGKIRDIKAVNPLAKTINDKDSAVRKKAAEALGEIGDKRAIQHLLDRLEREWFVKEAIKRALSELGYKEDSDKEKQSKREEDNKNKIKKGLLLSVQSIVAMLFSIQIAKAAPVKSALESESISYIVPFIIPFIIGLYIMDKAMLFIFNKVGKRTGSSKVTAIIDEIYNENISLRIEAARALGMTGTEKAKEILNNALEDEDNPDVRKEIEEALSREEKQKPESTEGQRKSEERERVFERLAKGDIEMHQSFLKNNYDVSSRIDAIIALGNIGGKEAAEVLKNYINAENAQVRKEVEKSLIKIGEPAIESVTEVLEDRNWVIRMRAAIILGEIGGEKAVEPLVEALKDDEMAVRMNAARALGKMDGEAADQA
ncbi:MAG: HEAT repeat domain-containing protein, partial [Elusimicrobiota bacterium]